jgi:DNA-binding transcriptional LysR family regulator
VNIRRTFFPSCSVTMSFSASLVTTHLFTQFCLISKKTGHLIVPASHRWAMQKSVKAQQLKNQLFIMREKGSGTRELIESELRRIGVKPNITMELGSNEAIKRAVESGVGLALLPPKVVQSEINQGLLRCLAVKGTQLLLKFNVVYHKDKESSRLVQAFLTVLAQIQRQLSV